VRMDIAALRANAATAEVLDDFGDWPPSNFVFSPDGKYLFGSSYYSGVSNIYRYDLTRQLMEPLSNTETGFFKPVPVPGDSVVVFRYTARGFVPAMIPNAVPDSVSAIRFLGNEIAATRADVQSWIPPRDTSLNLDSLTTSARSYRPLAHLALNSAYPLVEGYQDAAGTNAVAIGWRGMAISRPCRTTRTWLRRSTGSCRSPPTSRIDPCVAPSAPSRTSWGRARARPCTASTPAGRSSPSWTWTRRMASCCRSTTRR